VAACKSLGVDAAVVDAEAADVAAADAAAAGVAGLAAFHGALAAGIVKLGLRACIDKERILAGSDRVRPGRFMSSPTIAHGVLALQFPNAIRREPSS
jgi:hypothetical protein